MGRLLFRCTMQRVGQDDDIGMKHDALPAAFSVHQVGTGSCLSI